MPTHPELVAQTLLTLEAHRQAPHIIDDAYEDGIIDDAHHLVITSKGNSQTAVVTPMYRGFVYGSSLLERFDMAALCNRVFVEARIKVASNDRKQLETANVTLRYAFAPKFLQPNKVLETQARYPLDPEAEYGTMERVIAAIGEVGVEGATVPNTSGYVEVPDDPYRKNNDRWVVTDHMSGLVVAECIHEAVSRLHFTEL
ncbi:MAG: hypothetical protein JWO47_690 [Candidatus Saccharibacteria bacterium]|nr:hypothetical protein [Candidatus Saccharibacteria bacterium]